MTSEAEKMEFAALEIPKVKRGPMGLVKIVAALVAIAGAAWAWQAGYRPPLWFSQTRAPLRLVEVDEGDVEVFVVETGTVESASNATVRCKVEALIGLIGGTQGTTGTTAGTTSGTSGQGGGSGAAGAAGTTGATGTQGATGTGAETTKAKGKTAKKKAGASSSASKVGSAGATGTSTGSTSTSGSSSTTSGTGSSTAGSSTASGSGAGGAGGASSATSPTASTGLVKPVIRSFTYEVIAHTPLRPATAKAQDTSAAKKQQQQGKMAGGGGSGSGRGGGRGRRSMNMFEEEKPGSTRIVEILPEGRKVKRGDVVCRLDSSSYEDEKKAQLIRHIQAKSYVDQAASMLEVAQISQREYRDGIYPQDVQLIRQYIELCQREKDRLERNLEWSRSISKKGLRTPFQVKGDQYTFEQAQIALREAEGMLTRLTKQTGPKILNALQANVWAIEADKRLQDASFSLESQRLKRIEDNIANCTVHAPNDGIVVYANLTNPWGMVEAAIDQGVTLRQDQPIFYLPDPKNMRVKAKINESKFALVQSGQAVTIVVDAFPDRPLRGTVAEVTPISLPLRGSDVRIYYANVDILDEFEDLRPGLSAEIKVHVEKRAHVVRVPVDSVRWVDEQPYVALYDRPREQEAEGSWHWQMIEIGLSDETYAEVTAGLKAGDKVVAQPATLAAPNLKAAKPASTQVAAAGTPG
jgi:multidrug resistance efflux pump